MQNHLNFVGGIQKTREDVAEEIVQVKLRRVGVKLFGRSRLSDAVFTRERR